MKYFTYTGDVHALQQWVYSCSPYAMVGHCSYTWQIGIKSAPGIYMYLDVGDEVSYTPPVGPFRVGKFCLVPKEALSDLEVAI